MVPAGGAECSLRSQLGRHPSSYGCSCAPPSSDGGAQSLGGQALVLGPALIPADRLGEERSHGFH
jgi:hypothetical protein